MESSWLGASVFFMVSFCLRGAWHCYRCNDRYALAFGSIVTEVIEGLVGGRAGMSFSSKGKLEKPITNWKSRWGEHL